MKITGKRSIAYFLKLGVDLILLVNLVTLLTLPFILSFLYENARVQSMESGYSQSVSQESDQTPENSREKGDATEFPENSRWILLSEIPRESYGFMLGFLYFSGICTAMILFFLRRVLRNLERDVILDYANANIFKWLSLACFLLVLSFIVKMIFYNTFLTIFCFFIFIILGLFSLVLSEVFRQGAVVKEENELTI